VRITRLHLIVAFLAVSSLFIGAFLYVRQGGRLPWPQMETWLRERADVSADRAVLPQEPPAPADPSPPDAPAVDPARQRVADALARAREALDQAAGKGYDVSEASRTWAQAQNVFEWAQGLNDFAKAESLAEEALAQIPSSPVGAVYVVRRGDNFWNISKKLRGRGNQWVKIWRANEKAVPDFDALEAGQTLIVPNE
jgi:nucleoid-associated protein YgaU